MGLTETKLNSLKAKGFDLLYSKHRETWITMANRAYDYAVANISEQPRPDDVAKVLLPPMQVLDLVLEHQDESRSRHKYWVEWYVEYVIDQALTQKPATLKGDHND